MNTLQEKLWNKENLTILGGAFEEDKLTEFLKWPVVDELKYMIGETSDAITINRDDLPEITSAKEYLLRLRIFGDKGDLTIRRNGKKFLWWFVGEANVAQHPTIGEVEDFFKLNNDAQFWVTDDNSLLWGMRKNDAGISNPKFWDDRVAGASLDYPIAKDAERAQLRYRVLSGPEKVEFIWYLEICPYQDDKGE